MKDIEAKGKEIDLGRCGTVTLYLSDDRKRLLIGFTTEAEGFDKTGLNVFIDVLEKVRKRWSAERVPVSNRPGHTAKVRDSPPVALRALQGWAAACKSASSRLASAIGCSARVSLIACPSNVAASASIASLSPADRVDRLTCSGRARAPHTSRRRSNRSLSLASRSPACPFRTDRTAHSAAYTLRRGAAGSRGARAAIAARPKRGADR